MDSIFPISFEQGTLVSSGVDWSREKIENTFGKNIWTWDPRVSQWRCEAIHYRDIILTLWKMQDQGISFHDQARDWPDVHWSPDTEQQLYQPRPEQAAAIEAWFEGKRGCVVMPTGTGKTEVALHLLKRTLCSALVVSPVRDLMYQWHQRIKMGLGYDAGVIGDNTYNLRPVSVTTYDSAAIHADKLGNRFKLLIFDECHHLPGNFRRDAATMSIAPYRLGLTATPHRSDGRHADLKRLIGPVVYTLDIDSVKGKTLADFQVIKIPVHLNATEQEKYNQCAQQVRDFMYERRKLEPKFRWEDLCSQSANDPAARKVMLMYRHKQAIEDRAAEKLRVIEDLFRLHAGTPMIIFAGSNAMARDISIRFLIPCLLNHCGKRERQDILGGLADGTYPAIVANQVLDEGVDVPAVKIAIVVGGSASTRQAKQRLGRILRKSGNAQATLYEVVCQDTSEALKSRQRRKSDAYANTRHRRT